MSRYRKSLLKSKLAEAIACLKKQGRAIVALQATIAALRRELAELKQGSLLSAIAEAVPIEEPVVVDELDTDIYDETDTALENGTIVDEAKEYADV